MQVKLLAMLSAFLLVLAFFSVLFWIREAALILVTMSMIDLIAAMYIQHFKGASEKMTGALKAELVTEIIFLVLGFFIILIFDNWVGMMPYFYSLMNIFMSKKQRVAKSDGSDM
ncbi:Uncharacterised protein [Corynebacterium kutscheri]|uniref:Uncharacterized protein n=1 Tax=Corynebacterium kutscheri TaxID=35755 RepID=A0AB38VTH6_9CORY|nr:hypothetical protein [Corynebacterium kutscheri]VEH05430.1 Uncharacterised protein [Corynebacterium kutscheri]VEH80794.1 Uncharacterised protein [Corynebacterium kutscheri]